MNTEQIVSIDQSDREKFYTEVFRFIHCVFSEGNEIEISRLKKYLDDENLYSRLEDSINWEYCTSESPLTIESWKYYVFWDEFSEEDIKLICSSYIEDDDIDWFIRVSDGLMCEPIEESRDVSYFLANFPWNLLWAAVSKLRETPLLRKIRDKIDYINWM